MNIKLVINKYPYVLPLAAGIVLFLVSLTFDGKLSDLLVNVSASLVIIPIVIFLYEQVREKAEAEKNKDLSDYVKMQADRELLTLLNRIAPLVIGTPTPGLNKVLKLLQMTPEKMLKSVEVNSVMVFFLATDWLQSEKAINDLVSSELTYNNLNVEERNNFIRLIGAIRQLETATEPRYYKANGKPDDKYKVINGSELNKVNKFENRYLLMSKTKKSGQFAVAAFNDINIGKYRAEYTLPMLANNDGRRLLVDAVAEVLECIDRWHKLRGDVFLLDTRHFRAVQSPKGRSN
ncbi:MAG TPA: hypothetical protein VK497_03860 [Candidatus Saccharimonadales bacterium]|nr:hypothetical protein [Candidatus Saccharimonadales bacterium]